MNLFLIDMGRKSINYDETKIIRMLAEGYTVAEIAEQSSLNVRTLEAKLVRLRDKCGAHNNTHLACKYIYNGLIEPNY
jgi:DNA-binding NarL/FixJ family response regulator